MRTLDDNELDPDFAPERRRSRVRVRVLAAMLLVVAALLGATGTALAVEVLPDMSLDGY